MDNDPLITRITRLEDEVEVLRKERDRFKRIASNAEEETAKRRAEYLTLESEYEEERRKRRNAEEILDAMKDSSYASNSVSKSQAGSSSVSSVVQPDLVLMPSKVGSVPIQVQAESSSKPGDWKDHNQDIKKIDPDELIYVDSDIDSVKFGPPVRTSKRIAIKPKAKEVVALTHLDSPKKEKKRPADQISSTSESPDEPIKKAHKISTESSRPSKALGKVKAKDEGGFVLGPREVSKYMNDTSPYIIQPPPKPPRVSRACLTETYGLPGMGLLWISKDKRHRFLLPTFKLNPAMPSAVGSPGLLLSCRKDMCDGLPWQLFFPAVEEKKARWIYAGEYIGETVGLLSPEDFRKHNKQVKEAWGQKVEKHKKYPVYCALRARITLRLGGLSEPTESDVENEVVRIKRKDYTSNLTSQDVIAAFERGDEHISIVKLRCLDYKHEHEAELTGAQAHFDIREKANRLLKKNGGMTSRKNTRAVEKHVSTQQRGRRKNRKEFEDDSDSESEDSSGSIST